jgi:protein TonB
MGNLAYTNSVLESIESQSLAESSHVPAGLHPPLELFSKPILAGQPVKEESLWHGLWCNVRDALFARKLPPLELKSQPIAVADPLAAPRNPLSSALSFVLHAGILALIVWFLMQARQQIVAPHPVQVVTPVEFKPYIPITVPAPQPMGGGGGGGAHQIVQASKGHLPPVAKVQVAPVEMLKIDHPRLAVAPTVAVPAQVKLPANKIPTFGDPQAPQIALVSQGGGAGGGFGQAKGGGIGAGHGTGVGAGSGAGYGGGVMSVGGGVTAPKLIHRVEPEFSDQARQAKYQGVVSIQLIVDPHGNPVNIHVVHPLGMGLDEKAVAAVSQYKFAPAMFQGRPVPVQIVIDVDFHLN